MRRTPVVMPALTALALLTTACATTPRQPIDGTRQVRATVETTPVATGNDAADDPAIWRNAADPARSLIVATDKKAGLHVYELDGRQRQFLPAARLNNVDLRADLQLGGEPAVIVAASDRSQIDRAQLALFLLAPASGEPLIEFENRRKDCPALNRTRAPPPARPHPAAPASTKALRLA